MNRTTGPKGTPRGRGTGRQPARRPPDALVAFDGARAELVQGALLVRDPEGRTLFRYEAGSAELYSPEGDLTLAAPEGRVVLRAATDVELKAERDLCERAGHEVAVEVGRPNEPQLRLGAEQVALRSRSVRIDSTRATLETGRASVAARGISVTAEVLASHAERYELAATQIVERAREALHEVSELWQLRSARVRTVVRDLYELRSGRTRLVSEQDTSIDGKPVRLG
jgi:hypothetical protein